MGARSILILSYLLLWSCGDQPLLIALDDAGEQFVKLGLELGEYDEAYVDSYVGPAEWQKHAQERLRSKEELARATAKLLATVEAIEPASQQDALRRHLLAGKMRAMDARARMLIGEKFTFAEEAKLLLDANPTTADFAEFDRVLAEIDEIVSGKGDLNDRFDALRTSVVISRDKLDVVFRRAIEECRQRTLGHIDLPEDERFQLEYVSGVSWSGYLEYLGNHESLMSINTDVPMTLDSAVDLGCHEGYPGHHVYSLIVDQRFLKVFDWVEFQLQPLFAPASLFIEGSAEYAVALAFPGDESLAFQRAVLAPLANIDAKNVEKWNEVVELYNRLNDHAASAIAQRYLDGEMTRDQALRASIKYRLRTPEEAERGIRFIEGIGSYILTYSLGEEIVSTYIESQSDSHADKWVVFRRLIDEQPTATDLTRLH